MKTAILRFVPAWTWRAFDEPRLVREVMVARDALYPVKLSEPIPVVVDHDMDRQVGTVRHLEVRDEVISGAFRSPWWLAHVDISDPPGWLKRGGGVSWCHRNLRKWTPAEIETTAVLKCLIHEVSILSPSVDPAEPLARVVWVGEKESARVPAKPVGRVHAPAPAASGSFDDYRPPIFDELEKKLGYRVTHENFERANTEASRSPLDRLYAEHVAAKRQREPEVIIRYGIGQVLMVR